MSIGPDPSPTTLEETQLQWNWACPVKEVFLAYRGRLDKRSLSRCLFGRAEPSYTFRLLDPKKILPQDSHLPVFTSPMSRPESGLSPAKDPPLRCADANHSPCIPMMSCSLLILSRHLPSAKKKKKKNTGAACVCKGREGSSKPRALAA